MERERSASPQSQSKSSLLIEESGTFQLTNLALSSVGKLVVAALRHPEVEEAGGKALKVNSFEVTPNQVLAEYEKQTEAKWKVEYVPLKRLIEEEKKLWEEGHPKATVLTLRRIWSEGGTLYEKTDNGAIGLKTEDMESLEVILKRLLGGQ